MLIKSPAFIRRKLLGNDKWKNTYILVFWGFYNKNIADWIAYKQQKLISHGSVDWEVQNKDTGRFGVWQ